ncbi:MAG: hypothetical protein ETSY2_36405 [Candidatus Entotheonella gemina]|uniref:TIR domain-containing protein n=2 Tax=Candidatus Entotheonella TaxID=93171 RepID=W4LV47_9BACT|nr:MAG: hypothetical protein ETSY2_36405 [Candidatus Entotheonella gemina]
MWYDAELPGNVELTDTLKQRVEQSATLLIIMTRPYLSSDWCEKEREWFEKEIKQRGRGIENVFVVRAMATDNEKWPDFLKDRFGETVLGYPFCNEAEGRAARPFGWVQPTDSSTSVEFIDALTRLASDMATRLDDIRKTTPAPHATPYDSGARMRSVAAERPIFVAPGTEEVRPVVEEIRMQLEQKGFGLLPPAEVRIEAMSEPDEEQWLNRASAFVQCLGVTAAKDAEAEFGRVQLLNQRARQQSLPQFLWRDSKIPLAALGYDPTYQQFVESLGEIPDSTASELADEIAEYLKQQAAGSSPEQPLIAFIEVPADALSQFDQLKEGIDTDDCLLFPLKPPEQGEIRQIQIERKARQAFFHECHVILLMYCMANQLPWLTSAIINYERDITVVRRELDRCPKPVVIDYIGEAQALGATIGVDVIFWEKGSDPDELWRQLRSLAA